MPSKNKKSDPLARCKTASQMFPGAPISRVQLAAVEGAITPQQRRAASRAKKVLTHYASTGDKSGLSDQLKSLLRDVNGTYNKSWSRKSAAILVA